MGGSKKGKTPTDVRKPKHSNDAARANKTTKDGLRGAGTVRRLAMYNSKARRDKKGKILHQDYQSKDLPNTRIQPDRRWFGNTRTIGVKQLEAFRGEMAAKVADPYTVLLREKKLPLSLLEDPAPSSGGKAARASLVATQPFGATFGKKQTRKRPKLASDSYEALLGRAAEVGETFQERADAAGVGVPDDARDAVRDAVFEKGTSRRIWGELYKVVDSSDVIIQVLDARDPDGTRCRHLEAHLRKNARHKHMLLLLNKCDLVSAGGGAKPIRGGGGWPGRGGEDSKYCPYHPMNSDDTNLESR
jgi:nuclear GTP-binding protein